MKCTNLFLVCQIFNETVPRTCPCIWGEDILSHWVSRVGEMYSPTFIRDEGLLIIELLKEERAFGQPFWGS